MFRHIGITAAVLYFFMNCNFVSAISIIDKDVNKKEAKYVHKVQKEDEKEKYIKERGEHHPSGYMTVEQYELISIPKDRMEENVAVPKIPTPYDMTYIPQPKYKLVRYNNPPGSPELSVTNTFYQNRQQNSQGIVSPDFTKLVYPAVYYYPNSGSTACDLFVIKLDDAKTNLDKVLTANTIHRYPEPIMSTDKDNANYYTFRTITPVDFSSNGNLLLAKEKIGNEKDGMWKTTPYVYDFENKTLYSLEDVRSAIEYYWRGKGLMLRDKRWDVYPLGFSQEDENIVIVKALAYTGEIPVRLGVWSISAKGDNPKLISLENPDITISMNGLKLIKDGVMPPAITRLEEKQLKRMDKLEAKRAKQKDKKELKEIKNAYKERIKEMDAEFKASQKDYDLRRKINATTSENDALEIYRQKKEELAAKEQAKLEKKKAKEERALEKQKIKEEKNKSKIKVDDNSKNDETTENSL